MTFGTWIKEARKAAGLSQRDISKKLGYTSPQFVSNWERSYSHPPKYAVIKLSKALGVDVNAIKEKIYADKAEQLKQEWL